MMMNSLSPSYIETIKDDSVDAREGVKMWYVDDGWTGLGASPFLFPLNLVGMKKSIYPFVFRFQSFAVSQAFENDLPPKCNHQFFRFFF